MAIYRDEGFIKEVGLRIQKLRRKKKMSQGELAIRIESNRSAIGAIERGESNLQINTIRAIADALEVDDANIILPLKLHNRQL